MFWTRLQHFRAQLSMKSTLFGSTGCYPHSILGGYHRISQNFKNPDHSEQYWAPFTPTKPHENCSQTFLQCSEHIHSVLAHNWVWNPLYPGRLGAIPTQFLMDITGFLKISRNLDYSEQYWASINPTEPHANYSETFCFVIQSAVLESIMVFICS